MNQNKQIRILSLYFYPDIATTGQLLTELSVGLIKKGFSVNIITAKPTYKKINADVDEIYQGVIIKRLWSTQFNKNSFYGKIFNSVTFFISSLVYILRSSNTSSLLIVSNPPFLPLIGVINKFLFGTKFIFLVHDVYPDIAIRLGYLSFNSLTSKLWNVINRIILKSASKIVVLSDSMKNIIEKKISVPMKENVSGKIHVIHNWADEDFIKPINKNVNKFRAQINAQNNFLVMYSGNLGLFHKLETVIEAANQVQDSRIKFLFVGEGGKKDKLQRMAMEYGLKNVEFYPYVSWDEIPFSLTAPDIALVSLEKNIEGLAMPSKLYSLLAAGVPIVAFCDYNSDIAKIIQDANCGYAIDQDDVKGFIAIINKSIVNPKLTEELGNNARKYFENHFTFQKALNKYCGIIESL